jgi:hypothetical protein
MSKHILPFKPPREAEYLVTARVGGYETASRDQAQEAFDCLRACGLSPLSLGDGDSWDIRFAEQLYFFLATN